MQLLPRCKFQDSLSRTFDMSTVMSKYIGLQQTLMLMTWCLQTARLGWTVTATSADSCIVVVLHDSHVCVPFSVYQLALSLVYISSSTPLSPSVDKVFVWLDLHHAWLDTPSAFELVSSYIFPVVLLCPWRTGSPSNTMWPWYLRIKWHLHPSNRLGRMHQRYNTDRQTDNGAIA